MLDLHAAKIETTVREYAVVLTYSLNTVRLSPNTGYVEGEITFVDGSRFVFFEFLRRKDLANFEREKYRYHFMDANDQLIFRYDNAPHYPMIVTFPHHKHLPNRVLAVCRRERQIDRGLSGSGRFPRIF